jgi:hypothetical protein
LSPPPPPPVSGSSSSYTSPALPIELGGAKEDIPPPDFPDVIVFIIDKLDITSSNADAASPFK